MTQTIQVPTIDLHQHIGAQVRYGDERDDTWSTLTAVTDSPDQGWTIALEACTLQSCFADTLIDVREHEELYGCTGEAAEWIRDNVGLN